jgi:hypothetical protein
MNKPCTLCNLQVLGSCAFSNRGLQIPGGCKMTFWWRSVASAPEGAYLELHFKTSSSSLCLSPSGPQFLSIQKQNVHEYVAYTSHSVLWAKWEKPDSKVTYYMISFMWLSEKKGKTTESENRSITVRNRVGWGGINYKGTWGIILGWANCPLSWFFMGVVTSLCKFVKTNNTICKRDEFYYKEIVGQSTNNKKCFIYTVGPENLSGPSQCWYTVTVLWGYDHGKASERDIQCLDSL